MAEPIVLALHGHFYQPPRENPWTEEVPREPGADPFHDWNERIALESYRPNAFARVVDDRNRVVSIVNNYEHITFDVGPTLTSWLAEREPEAMGRIVEADAASNGGIAQAYYHLILPLADERDVRTMVRWGLREFAFRFGRDAKGIWLPETAVNSDVLRVLAEEGVAFTVLAPYQSAEPVDTRCAYRWTHPERPDLGIDLVFYDGGLSHAIAFELGSMSSEAFVDRVAAAAPDGGLVTVAADGETFGHHHRFGDRFLAYALAVEAPKRGIEVQSLERWLAAHVPTATAEVIESAWSCAHGVGRWKEDCGCSTGGGPGWNQEWRAPLRAALDVVRDAVFALLDGLGREHLRDPWVARDAYVDVLLGATSVDDFVESHVVGDTVTALTVLEAARHALAMYTSCGWFFNDLAGLETVQLLRYAARALDCLDELGEHPPTEAFLAVLDGAVSNDPNGGTGRDIWHRHVLTARVDEARAATHLALLDLLEQRAPGPTVGAFDVEVLDHGRTDRGSVAIAWGKVRLTHRRTRRTTEQLYGGVHLGGLEILGATRPAGGESSDAAALERLRDAATSGAPVTTVLQLVGEFGPTEFDVESGMPEAAGEVLKTAARALTDRFGAAFERLYLDHRSSLVSLSSAGLPLPAELRRPAELALARLIEREVTSQRGSIDLSSYEAAIALAREARVLGIELDSSRSRRVLERLLVRAVEHAVAAPGMPASDVAAEAALAGLDLAAELRINVSLDRSQEIVFAALADPDGSLGPLQPASPLHSDSPLARLVRALGFAL